MIPIVAPKFYEHFPVWFATIFHSGISSAALVAIVLNLLFNHFTLGNSDQPSVFAAGGGRYLRVSDVANLNEGDYVENGKIIDKNGKEVPIIADEHPAPEQPPVLHTKPGLSST
jgi:hypothetical protein